MHICWLVTVSQMPMFVLLKMKQATKNNKLTSSPGLPGGPSGPREPTGP